VHAAYPKIKKMLTCLIHRRVQLVFRDGFVFYVKDAQRDTLGMSSVESKVDASVRLAGTQWAG
jgi:hypothetical protein